MVVISASPAINRQSANFMVHIIMYSQAQQHGTQVCTVKWNTVIDYVLLCLDCCTNLPMNVSLHTVPAEVKAMRLWSDWNIQASRWASKHLDDQTFDYLRIRTEDLVNPETKYNIYRKVARFVGADLNEDQVCCLMRKPAKWMGSHDR